MWRKHGVEVLGGRTGHCRGGGKSVGDKLEELARFGPTSGCWDMGDLGGSTWEGRRGTRLGQKLGFKQIPEEARA